MMRRIVQISAFVIATSCVEPIAFDIPSVSFQLIVDGSITNQPGPYTVHLSRPSELRYDLDARVDVPHAKVVMFSDAGEEDVLREVSAGVYQTTFIQGVIGRSYWLTIRTEPGGEYESEPELLNPVGELKGISWKFQQDNILSNGVEVAADRFDVLVDGIGANLAENYYRWRTTGTFAVRSYPHLIDSITPEGLRVPNPPPCSGYVVNEGRLSQANACTCCDCWVTVKERQPYVHDDSFINGGSFRNIHVGAVPVNRRTFYEKYNVSVEQISLTKGAYEFFHLIRAQKEGASSLFQPATGKLKSNIRRTDAKEEVHGYFWAGAVDTKMIFIDKTDVPYPIPPIDSIELECFRVVGAMSAKPDFWD